MLGKNIIELQEDLSYMPMQKLIDMVDSPDSIYGALTLVEIKNRESLQNSATDMSPTPTVAEDVISSVASPASLDSSPNLSPNSGGIANLEQPQPPMQMMAEGRTVRLSDEEDFSLPPGGLMDLLGEGETPYLGDEEVDELNQIEAEEDFKDMIDYERSNSQIDFDDAQDLISEQIDRECIYYSDCFDIVKELNAVCFEDFSQECEIKNITQLAYAALTEYVHEEINLSDFS